MKVYELIQVLQNAPAGMDIRVHPENGKIGGDLLGAQIDGSDSDGLVTLIFNQEEDQE